MKHRPAPFLFCFCIFAMALALIAQNSATEALAGFTTPYVRGSEGIGPVFNASSCASCHANPVTGGSSQITEVRVGHLNASGGFVNPTVTINDGANTIGGRSLINDRAICAQAQEHMPATENIRALRAVLNTFGDGFVEAIEDSTLMAIAQAQPVQSNGLIAGEAVQEPVLEAPGQTRVGRFGWKNQHSSLLSFVADAYLNEMGVTSRLRPTDSTTVCKTTTDPEDNPDALGMAHIDHFTQFIRGTHRYRRGTPCLRGPRTCKPVRGCLNPSGATSAMWSPSRQRPRGR